MNANNHYHYDLIVVLAGKIQPNRRNDVIIAHHKSTQQCSEKSRFNFTRFTNQCHFSLVVHSLSPSLYLSLSFHRTQTFYTALINGNAKKGEKILSRPMNNLFPIAMSEIVLSSISKQTNKHILCVYRNCVCCRL